MTTNCRRRRPDYYHTCYCLSGLSCAQHLGCAYSGPRRNVVVRAESPHCAEHRRLTLLPALVHGARAAVQAELDPVWNLESDMAMRAEAYFRALPCTHEALL